MTTLLRRLSLALAALLILSAVPESTFAQAVSEDAPNARPYWTHTINEQIDDLLSSEIPLIREQGLRLVIELKSLHGESLDLRPTASRIVDLYLDTKQQDGDRLLALSALSSIDSTHGYNALLQWYADGREPSERVHRTLHAVLRDYQVRHGIS